MSSIGERLLAVRGDVSQAVFAKALGINPNTLRSYERGLAIPNQEVLARICVNFSVSPEWLLLGEDATASSNISTGEKNYLIEDSEDLIRIPMAKAVLSAGTGSLETSGENERSYAFRRDFIQRKGNPNHMVLMRVHGDSMQPEIMDNDVVLIDQSKKQPTPGPIFAVGFEDAIYLKRVDFLPGKVILKSVNPEYPPVELAVVEQTAEQFRVIGQVLWVGREYKNYV